MPGDGRLATGGRCEACTKPEAHAELTITGRVRDIVGGSSVLRSADRWTTELDYQPSLMTTPTLAVERDCGSRKKARYQSLYG